MAAMAAGPGKMKARPPCQGRAFRSAVPPCFPAVNSGQLFSGYGWSDVLALPEVRRRPLVKITAHMTVGLYSAKERLSGRSSGLIFAAPGTHPAPTGPDSLGICRRLLFSVNAFFVSPPCLTGWYADPFRRAGQAQILAAAAAPVNLRRLMIWHFRPDSRRGQWSVRAAPPAPTRRLGRRQALRYS